MMKRNTNMAEPVKDNYLRTSEINILKEKLCVGLKPNAEPPQDMDELLRELKRLKLHFSNAEKIQKDCLAAYEEIELNSDSSVNFICYLGVFVFAGIVWWIFDDFLIHLLIVALVLWLISSPFFAKYKLSVLRSRFVKLYNSAEHNFVYPEDVFFLPKLCSLVEIGNFSSYDSLMAYFREYLNIMNQRLLIDVRLKETKRMVKTLGIQQNAGKQAGVRILCSHCGYVFYGSGVGDACPNCGMRSKTTSGNG